MKLSKKSTISSLLAILPIASAHADVLAQWTFNTGANSSARLASSSVAHGTFISGLSLNDSFSDFGPGAVPNDVHDGFGFGGAIQGAADEQVIFLHRATYFDGSPVPDPRPTEGDYTSWGDGSQQGTGADLGSNGNAPIAFTVSADAISTVTIDSITVDFFNSAAIIFQFQEAGASAGPPVTANTALTSYEVLLDSPVVIAPGETKTFTINVNSGALNSFSNIDGLALNGTVVRDTAVPGVAAWTFNNLSSVATALESSGVTAGLTVSSLAVNPSHTSFGVGAVPNTDDDGFGFGGNDGEDVMFIHRANYFNGGAGTTTWGNPINATGVDTTTANSPLSFTVTTDGTTQLTLVSLTVDRTPSAPTLYFFQEDGALAGVSPAGTDDPSYPALNAPVVLNPGETRTFTVNLNSGNLDSAHILNQISLNGTVETIVADPYQDWAGANGLTEGVNDGFGESPDFDPFPSGLEWILGGTTPLDFDRIGIGTTGELLNMEVDGSNNLVFTFQRIDESEGEATLKVQFSNDLFAADNHEVTVGASGPEGVPPSGVTVDVVENADAPDDVTVTIPASYGDPDGRLFGRLEATRP